MATINPVKKTSGVLKEFQGFLLRGNVVDLAVAVVIGAAFTGVIKSFSSNFITPMIGAIFGGKDIFSKTDALHWRGQTFAWGIFVNDVITFVITCAVVFFFVVKPVGHMMRRLGYAPPEDPQKFPCPQCATDITPAAKRCPQCTSELGENWAEVAA